MKIKIEFEIELPDIEHTEDELEEFLRFEYRDNGRLNGMNPFNNIKCNMDPIFGSFEWEYID
jgi:hypothetical protein